MTLMSWLYGKAGNRPASDKFAEAMRATDEFTVKVRSLREQLEPYARENDPFAAIMTAHDSAEDYTRGVLGDLPGES